MFKVLFASLFALAAAEQIFEDKPSTLARQLQDQESRLLQANRTRVVPTKPSTTKPIPTNNATNSTVPKPAPKGPPKPANTTNGTNGTDGTTNTTKPPAPRPTSNTKPPTSNSTNATNGTDFTNTTVLPPTPHVWADVDCGNPEPVPEGFTVVSVLPPPVECCTVGWNDTCKNTIRDAIGAASNKTVIKLKAGIYCNDKFSSTNNNRSKVEDFNKLWLADITHF